MADIRLWWVGGLVAAWRFVLRIRDAVLRRVRRLFRTAAQILGASNSPPRVKRPLGVEIVALGVRARAVFKASRRVTRMTLGPHVDVAIADTAAEGAGVAAPIVVLAEAPAMLSVPAFDLRIDNPIGCRRDVGNEVGALGPLDRLPSGCAADRVVRRDDRAALGGIHHLEDVAAFHADALTRAGDLARLAATGVVVRLADGDRGLVPYLGAELFELMTSEVRDLDAHRRESLGIKMRRTALREHSLTSRVRRVTEYAALANPLRLPLVSILLATRRPELLELALAGVRRQSYPRLELVLALHGEGFGEVAADAAGAAVSVTALRLDSTLPLGSVLNAATRASRGSLLAKMDDDDLYGPDHVWDLVLAQEYSQAALVGKKLEYVYLAASNRTVRIAVPLTECYESTHNVAGGTLLIERQMLDRIGGWKRLPRHVDRALLYDVLRTDARVYATHSRGFMQVRHGRRHTWEMDGAWFLARAKGEEPGFRPDLADIDEAQLPYSTGGQGRDRRGACARENGSRPR